MENSVSDPVLVIGSGGHAKVLIGTLIAIGAEVVGLTDEDEQRWGQLVLGVRVLGGDDRIRENPPSEIVLVNGLGSTRAGGRRSQIFESFSDAGYRFGNVIHPTVDLSPSVLVGTGVQLMSGAILQPGSSLGRNVIVNTGASIDHDCVVGDHVHISPGATVGGGVTLGDGVHVGLAAAIVQGVKVGEGATIGAGALVLSDVEAGNTEAGVPARPLDLK